MKFTASCSALMTAFEVVATVTPKALNPAGATGYLFVIRDGDCVIYSRDSLHVSRASLPIKDVEGDGAFILPTACLSALKFFAEQDITFEATSDGETFSVSYETGSGAKTTKATIDPALLATCDKDLEAAESVALFPAGVLRFALSCVRPFLGQAQDGKVEEHLKTAQVFDASKAEYSKGNGYMFGSNNTLACYVECSAFTDKALAVHSQHLPLLTAFLAKVEGQVEILSGKNMLFARDSEGRVLGWAHHHKLHPRFSYYALNQDKVVLRVPRRLFADALAYVRSEMDSKTNKVRFAFTRAASDGRPSLTVSSADEKAKIQAFPVPVEILEEDGALKDGEGDWAFNMNVDHLALLVNDYKGHQVTLRVGFVKVGSKTMALFRTIDQFKLSEDGTVVPDGPVQCTITRLSPSKD